MSNPFTKRLRTNVDVDYILFLNWNDKKRKMYH